ncbi:hypothetical protein JR316_0012240 [Psilocybe cubensis]|uniref:Uncharacterized protein n=2 Tax=Psilocybe cubensis TaxID=181762 RepID=A0ACB8GJ85_PSICU|nr:hypothetical protein JR316_0012240 [Psilocybe cubensis]KAH9475129.1 hypothetical protein JR316_0012240 [Psilocybe cubensis]
MDCIHRPDFIKLPIDIQREYAEVSVVFQSTMSIWLWSDVARLKQHYRFPSPNQLSLEQISALLSGIDWIPALKHHVWIPRPDFKGVTVSRDLNDLETWCANAVVAETLGTQKSRSLIPLAVLYSLLREQFEEGQAYMHGRVPQDEARKDSVAKKGRYTAVASMSQKQIVLSMARIRLIRSKKYLNSRQPLITLREDLLGQIVRDIAVKSNSSTSTKDETQLDEVKSLEISKLSRGRVAELRLAAKISAQSLHDIKAQESRSLSAQSGPAREPQQTTNDSVSSKPASFKLLEDSGTADPGAKTPGKAALRRSDSIKRDKRSPKSSRRRKSGRRKRLELQEYAKELETSLKVIHEADEDGYESDDFQSTDPMPQGGIEDEYEFIPSDEDQDFDVDVSPEVEEQTSEIGVPVAQEKHGSVSGIIAGFKSICADASNAVAGGTQTIVSGVHNLLAIGRPKRKRNLADEGIQDDEVVNDQTPTTPTRKRARIELDLEHEHIRRSYTQDTLPAKTTPSPSARSERRSLASNPKRSYATRRRRAPATRVTISEFGQIQRFPMMDDRMDTDPPARAYTREDETQNISTVEEAGPPTSSTRQLPRTRAMALSSSSQSARPTGVKFPLGRN